jgi:adenylosuccinate synthase
MPVTVVVGGQFGSEGKGKVAHYLAKEMNASAAIRCGGPNSGHTVIDTNGSPIIFQQLPTASILPDISIVLCAGMYIDIEILHREIEIARLSSSRLFIDPSAIIITPDIKKAEIDCGLVNSIGSTGSGTGEAVIRRIQRYKDILFAKNEPSLSSFVKDTKAFLRKAIENGKRVILEGTQGFGLSLYHSPFYPYVTSRDTTASGFLSESGLSPTDVDDVVLTIRAFPIRVAGNSGPLESEIDWETVTLEGGHSQPIEERTSVTNRRRRVARFDSKIVKEAIIVNAPSRIVLNHLDYLKSIVLADEDEVCNSFVKNIELQLNRKIDLLGYGPDKVSPNKGDI